MTLAGNMRSLRRRMLGKCSQQCLASGVTGDDAKLDMGTGQYVFSAPADVGMLRSTRKIGDKQARTCSPYSAGEQDTCHHTRGL